MADLTPPHALRLENGKVRIVGDSQLLNGQSITDLQGIRKTMIDNKVQINDLQFLISNEGRVVVADPLAINLNVSPSKNNLQMIELLIQAAKKEWKMMMETKNTPLQFRMELNNFIAKRVVKLVRYSWWPKEDISDECGISRSHSFSLTAGPMEVVFDDGSSIGVASDPGINSLIVWMERDIGGEACASSPLANDDELYSVSADDEEYSEKFWKKFLNRKLIGFSILKKVVMSALESELPSELALCFIFEENLRFIASHGLHDGSDDFSVLMPNYLTNIQKIELMEISL